MALPEQTSLAIVVVTWNCAEHLRALIASMNQHLEGSSALIVVDNASRDDPERELAAWKGPARFIPLERNIGFGAASNIGVGEVSAAVTVLLNPDTELLDAGLERLASTALERRALVGPRVLNSDGTVQPSASGPEVGFWPWVRALVPAALQPGALLARTEPYRCGRPLEVEWLTGACIVGPTDVLLALGPFDPQLHMYGEDIDLGLRARARGIRSRFDPLACRIVHHGQGSSALIFGSREGWRPAGTLNWRAALRRAYGPRRECLGWLALRLNLRLRLLFKSLLGRAGERDRLALAGAVAARPAPVLGPPPGGAGALPPRPVPSAGADSVAP